MLWMRSCRTLSPSYTKMPKYSPRTAASSFTCPPVSAPPRTGLSSRAFATKPPLLKYIEKLDVGFSPHISLPSPLDKLGFKFMDDYELRRRFHAFDLNNDGVIDIHEARGILQEAGHLDDEKQAAELITRINQAGGHSADSCQLSKSVSWDHFSAAIRKAQEQVDRRAYLIGASLSLNFTCQGMMSPILPLLGRSLGCSIDQVGLIGMANVCARLSSTIPLAFLVDRVGRRPLLVCGPLVSSMAFAAMGTSTCATQLALGCGLSGVGTAMTMGAASMYLNDMSTPANRSRTLAPLMMSGYFGLSVGPAIGGLLASATTLHAPPLVGCAGLLVTSMSAYSFLPETRMGLKHKKKVEQGFIRLWANFFRRPPLRGINVANLFSGFSQGSAPVTVILLASETLNMSPASIGLYFTSCVGAMALCTPLVTKLSDRATNRLQFIVPGLLLYSVALSLQSMALTPEWFAVVGIAGAIGNSWVAPNLSAYVIDHCKPYERAQALAKLRMCGDVGALIGVGTMSLVASHVGIPLAMQICASLQFSAALYCGYQGKLMDSLFWKK